MCPGFDLIDYDEITSKNPINDSSGSLQNEVKNLQKKENHSSTEIVEMRDINLSETILDELKGFSDEDLILIYDRVLRKIAKLENKDSDGFLEIESYSDFNEIKRDINKSLKKIKKTRIVKEIFDNVRELKIHSTPLNHLKDAKSDHRLCNFSYNFIKNINKKDDIKFHYYENPYLHINHLICVKSNFTASRHPRNIKISQRIFVREIQLKNNLKILLDKKSNIWLYEYLIKNNKEFFSVEYSPVNHKQRLNLIISFFDYLAHFKKDEYDSLTKNINRAWTQKKHRESQKTPLDPYTSLSKDVKKRLKEISKIMKKSEHEVLSSLICDKHLELIPEDKI